MSSPDSASSPPPETNDPAPAAHADSFGLPQHPAESPVDGTRVDDVPVELPTTSRGLAAEFWDFIVHEKIWWMTPILVVLLAMVAFILYAEASPVLPFIYAL